MKVSAMIVDDQEDIRLLMRMLIDYAPDHLEVRCEAASGIEALEIVEQCDPTVVVLDEMMPGMNGVETATQLRARRPDQLMILCSAYLNEEIERRALAAGVAAVVHKDAVRTLPAIIAAVASSN